MLMGVMSAFYNFVQIRGVRYYNAKTADECCKACNGVPMHASSAHDASDAALPTTPAAVGLALGRRTGSDVAGLARA